MALESGWDPKDLCEHLGHTSIKTTYDIYAHIMPKRKKEKAKKAVGFIPGIGPLFFSIASIWQLAAMVIAIRQALDFTSTWRAVGVAIVGFIPYALATYIIYALI